MRGDHGFISTFFFYHFCSLLQQHRDPACVYTEWSGVSNVKKRQKEKKKIIDRSPRSQALMIRARLIHRAPIVDINYCEDFGGVMHAR